MRSWETIPKVLKSISRDPLFVLTFSSVSILGSTTHITTFDVFIHKLLLKLTILLTLPSEISITLWNCLCHFFLFNRQMIPLKVECILIVNLCDLLKRNRRKLFCFLKTKKVVIYHPLKNSSAEGKPCGVRDLNGS